MVSFSSLVPAAAAAAAILLPPILPARAADAASSIFRPGMPKGSVAGGSVATGSEKSGFGQRRKQQAKEAQYCHPDREPHFAVHGDPSQGECLLFPETRTKRVYAYPEVNLIRVLFSQSLFADENLGSLFVSFSHRLPS